MSAMRVSGSIFDVAVAIVVWVFLVLLLCPSHALLLCDMTPYV